MKSVIRKSLVVIIVAAVATALVWGFIAGRADKDEDDDAPVKAPPRIAQVNGQAVLNFDEQAQRENGIVTTALAATRRSSATPAAATVVDLQPLLDLKSKYSAAQTAIAQARAAATASQAELKRLTGLNAGGDNVSQKSIEAAQAAAASDAATLDSALQSFVVLQDSTRLHWSPTVASWIGMGSAQLDALLSQRSYLLQITATSPGAWTAPAEAVIQLPDGTHLSARRVAALPQIDTRLQAPSYLYAVPAHAGLIPGVNLPVSLPAGPLQRGVIIPQSSVVWAQGQAWVYVENNPGKFTRQQVFTTNPAPGGWFITGTPGPGAHIVTGGAQTLFAEEFRSQIEAGDED